MKTLVGIDFSLNSPAFCVWRSGEFQVGSLTRSERSESSLKKSEKKPFSVLGDLDWIHFIFMDKGRMPEDYLEKERIKIDYFSEVISRFWGKILEVVGDDEISVAIEGLSFGSQGNALIDISMATAILRKDIIKRAGRENFYVFSPATVKKFAFKGNAKKYQLYDSLVSNATIKGTNLGDLAKILKENRHEWVTASGNVNKPLDDVVDAIWICLYLKSYLE